MNSKKPSHNRFRNPLYLAISAAIGASTAVLSLPHAYAQDGGSMLEEVVVTATRRAASLQETPLNISALSGDQIDRLELKNIRDIADWVPGLTVLDQGSRDGTPIIVRGLNTNSFDEPRGPGGTVGTYIGEIPVYIDLNLNDIERVEALIGPQGTLYGAGTLGGAIRYIPNKVKLDEFEAEINVGVSQNKESDGDDWETGVILNMPLFDGKLGIRASYNVEEIAGFIDYNSVIRQPGISNPQPDFGDSSDVNANLRSADDSNGSRINSGKVAVRYAPSSLFDATLAYYYQKQASDGQSLVHNYRDVAGATTFQTGKYENGFRYEEPLTREDKLISLEVSSDLDFAELVVAAGYSETDKLGQRDQTDLLLNFEFGYEQYPDFSAFTRDEVNRDNTTLEIRMVSQNEGPLSWIVGYFYNQSTLDQDIREFVPGFPEFAGVVRPDNLEFIQVRDGETTESAFFGEIGYQITEKWQATIGARFYEYEDELTVQGGPPFLLTSIGVIGPDDIPLRGPTNESDDSGELFKFNTSYTFSDDLMLYYTLSEGYRIGGTNPVADCTGDGTDQVCGLPNEIPILPDTTLNNELGIRSQLFDGRATLNAALFHIDWEDIQVRNRTVNGAARITVNGEDAVSQGVEISFAAMLNENWSLLSNYAYTDAELTADAPGIGEDGDRLAATPKTSASLGVNYVTTVFNSLNLSVNYNLVYTGDIYSTVGLRDNGEKLSSYTTHGISTSLSGDQWAATIYVSNLTNKYAVTGIRQDPSFLREVNGLDLRSYGRWINTPRAVGARFTYRF